MSKRIYPDEAPRDLRYFEAKFEARIEDSKEYKQYVRQMPSFQYGWDQMSYTMDHQVVPMKSIHLTIDSLERLVKEQDYLRYVEERSEHALKVLDMLRADERVRDSNPSVDKAYKNYIMLLELARK